MHLAPSLRPFARRLAASCLAMSFVAIEAPDDRPNLVFFLVDDMGWQDTSVPFHESPTPFNQHFRTPNMERLADQGRKFVQAYACCVCSPTRTSLMTGQNAARHGVTNWTLEKDGETSGRTAHLGPPADWRRNGLQPGEPTLPALLHRAGYRTIHVGKAHWGAHDTPGSDPRALGFDVNVAGHAAGGPGDYHGEKNYGNASPGATTRPWGVPGLEKYHGTSTHLTDALTIEACAAVRESVAAGQPFSLYLAHYAVHAPIQPHEPYDQHYRGQHFTGSDVAIDDAEANYASMVEGMDASLGRVLDLLDELGVAERTLVVFTSDNGGLSAHARGRTPEGTGVDTHNRPLRAGKGSAYEGGVRVPLIVSYARPAPEHPVQRAHPVAQGTSRQVVMVEDWFPTLVHLGGADEFLRDEERAQIDGLDLGPWIGGADDAPRSEPVLFHYPHVWSAGFLGRGEGYEPHSAMRAGDWKIVYFYEADRWELYDLAHDLEERHDLANERPDELETLARRLRDELVRRDAKWPVRLTDGTPVPLRLPSEARRADRP